jgi:hypothetical protein
MSKADALFDWLLFTLPKKVSGTAILVIALAFYPGVALILPLGLSWSGSWVFSANILGTTLAAFVTLGWLLLQVEARDRRHLLEWTADLRLLDAGEFEWLVGELFRREGWTIEETGHQDAPDGNIDLRLARGGERRIVQCKRWQSWLVGVSEIREFAGTLGAEKPRATAGIFVTLSGFTKDAIAFAHKCPLTLIDGRDLHARLEKVRRVEPCPKCGHPMLLGKSERGWWFRCRSYPSCDGKRDLGVDPGRAVELLTTEA